jgi:hypothetical protein
MRYVRLPSSFWAKEVDQQLVSSVSLLLNRESNPVVQEDQRVFQCGLQTKGGRTIAILVTIEREEREALQEVAWTLGAELLSSGQKVVNTQRGPGCSFVWDRMVTVRDVRLYVVKKLRNQGFGHSIICFIKAFLFPWQCQNSERFHYPFGGALPHLERLSNNPVVHHAITFYTRQGFFLSSHVGDSQRCFEPRTLRVKGEFAGGFAAADDPIDC